MTNSQTKRSVHLRRPLNPDLRAAGLAIGVHALALMLSAVAIAIFYPRFNPSGRLWHAESLSDHTLFKHAVRSGDRGDSDLYLQIARDGYGASSDLFAWFPGYPMLVRAVGAVGLPLWIAGTLISFAALVATAVLLRRCATAYDDGGQAAVWLWLVWPMAVVAGWIGPYSLVAALIAGVWLAALKGRPLTAGALGAAAALSHPAGVCVAALIFARPHRRCDEAGTTGSEPRRMLVQRLVAVAAVVAAAALWPVAVGSGPADVVDSARAQGRSVSMLGPINGLSRAGTDLASLARAASGHDLDLRATPRRAQDDAVLAGTLNLLGVLAMFMLVLALRPIRRALGLPAAVYCGLLVLAVLSVPLRGAALQAGPHVALFALPFFVWAGRKLSRDEPRLQLTVAASAMAFGAFTTMAALWHWVGPLPKQ